MRTEIITRCPDRTTRMCRWYFSWLYALIFLLGAPASFAQKIDNINEYQLKAVFIYNFSKFIEWPESAFTDPSSNFEVCVVGDNPFGDALQALNNRNYKTHPLVIAYPQTIEEARNCRILYVGDTKNAAQWKDLIKNLGDAPVLTVSSSDDAVQTGIGIGFIIKEGKIRWALNLNASRKAQLKISAKLIEIAISITGETPR